MTEWGVDEPAMQVTLDRGHPSIDITMTYMNGVRGSYWIPLNRSHESDWILHIGRKTWCTHEGIERVAALLHEHDAKSWPAAKLLADLEVAHRLIDRHRGGWSATPN